MFSDYLGVTMMSLFDAVNDPREGWIMDRAKVGKHRTETHHTVLGCDVTAQQMKDWARMMDIEFVHITKDATVGTLEKELFLNDLAWKLK